MKALILGADGFIGRQIAFHLRNAGWEVTACARHVDRLSQMGFATLKADLLDPATHQPAFWRAALAGEVHLINAAGLLDGSEEAFEAVHLAAPSAARAALDRGRMVHISAVGIDAAQTRFARWRLAAELALAGDNVTVLRAGLVLGETSYGGSSLLRALAAMPFLRPVIGRGDQRFNPIHGEDLAEVIRACLTTPPTSNGAAVWEIGGPEDVTQSEMLAIYRRWLGLRPAPLLRLPLKLARALGHIGDALSLGPISSTAVAQLEAGVHAAPAPLLARIKAKPRGFSRFLSARPAGTQDLWQARLYLLKPVIRLSLAALWIGSAQAGLLTPPAQIYALVPALPEGAALALGRAGGLADLMIALALLGNWRPKLWGVLQLALVCGYTLGLSVIAPALWTDPIGGMLKNLPILALILTHLALIEER